MKTLHCKWNIKWWLFGCWWCNVCRKYLAYTLYCSRAT